jgi:hypothetical protein
MASTSVIFTTAPVLVARSDDRRDRSRKITAGPGTILTLAAYYLATTQNDHRDVTTGDPPLPGARLRRSSPEGGR